MVNYIPITKNGFKQLTKKLEYLKNVHRPKIINSIISARKHGDLKENAEYHAAKEEQNLCELKIKQIETKISNAQIIDITKIPTNGKVVFGSTVTIKNMSTNKIKKYQIVGEEESNYKKKMISIYSPIARGLIGKKEKEITKIKTPKGTIQYQIIKIKYI